MTVWNFVQYSLIILSGLLSACVTAILYVELRWNLNPLTLVVPWLAVSGLILALAVRPAKSHGLSSPPSPRFFAVSNSIFPKCFRPIWTFSVCKIPIKSLKV